MSDGRRERQPPRRPNIVLIVTDDQDVELGSMEFMPKTLRIMRERGAEFTHGLVSTPICCPSRSSLLTGLYVHNHHVHTNNQNCSGEQWRSVFERRSFGTYLSGSGYRTGYFGKYLNDYDGTYVPPGWHEWMGLVKNSRFYNYSVNFNGKIIYHGDDYSRDYFTDLITNDSLAFLQRSRQLFAERPTAMVLSFPAPHGPEDPAPQFSRLFEGAASHRTAAYNYAPNPDKQWILRHTGKLEPVHVVFTDFLHRRRLQTLQSVDDAVHRVVAALRELRLLRNTYIIYTSDHGYHLGQFGLIKGKNMPFEFDIKVPYYIRGPGVPRGIRVTEPVTNVDLAPTMLDMAALPVPATMDGRSVLPLLARSDAAAPLSGLPWRHTVLVERGKMPQLQRLKDRLMRQRDIYGKEMRLQRECERPDYAAPCGQDQMWECRRNHVGRWRIFKCRGSVPVEQVCVCQSTSDDDEAAARERHRRSLDDAEVEFRRFERRSYASLEHDNQSYAVPEYLLQEWETEFIRQSFEKELIRRGSWHQGVFGESDSEPRRRGRRRRDAPSDGRRRVNGKRSSRRKSSAVFTSRRCKLDGGGGGGGVSCDPSVFEDLGEWRTQKQSVDNRIQNLRERLSAAKNMRKHLRRGRPDAVQSDEGVQPISTDDGCQCALRPSNVTLAHPLRSPSSAPIDISPDALMAYVAERSRRREGRRGGGGGRRRGRGRKGRRRKEKQRYCNIAQMNCFVHDSEHWKSPPLWPEALGHFCFCHNANNNSYWCLRTVNETHNFLYCEHVTGFLSFYDISVDPFQLENAIYQLEVGVLEDMSAQLSLLKGCQGWEECERYSGANWRDSIPTQQTPG